MSSGVRGNNGWFPKNVPSQDPHGQGEMWESRGPKDFAKSLGLTVSDANRPVVLNAMMDNFQEQARVVIDTHGVDTIVVLTAFTAWGGPGNMVRTGYTNGLWMKMCVRAPFVRTRMRALACAAAVGGPNAHPARAWPAHPSRAPPVQLLSRVCVCFFSSSWHTI